jgi:hypothetical protein
MVGVLELNLNIKGTENQQINSKFINASLRE